MKALLDTNVLPDIALRRQPFYDASARVLAASDFKRVHLFITASIVTDLYYVVRKGAGRDAAIAFIRDLLECVDVCGVDKAAEEYASRYL